jgi:hypothetical protein
MSDLVQILQQSQGVVADHALGLKVVAVDTDLGRFVVWETSLYANICLNGKTVSDWIIDNEKDIDRQWTDMVRDEEHVRDAVSVFANVDKCMAECARVYGKWEPILRIMCVKNIQNE